MFVGTLGCFVRLSGGGSTLYILSNNHVVAGENWGFKGQDRILQPGSAMFPASDQIATLHDFVPIQFSPPGATIVAGTAILNDVDAGIAGLTSGARGSNGYLQFRQLNAPSGTAVPQVGDRVFKVGRTTGLTHGEINSIATIVGPVDYGGQPAWFRNTIEIEGLNGALFSDRGDSGSAIVKQNTNEVLGLLFAGNGQQTYDCSIEFLQSALNCYIA